MISLNSQGGSNLCSTCGESSILDSEVLLCRDWSSILEWSIDKIPKITKNWTDFNITDPGILWTSAMANLYDYTHYMLDQKYVNNIARYSQSTRNLIDMCNTMGLEVSGLNASMTELLVDLNHGNNVDLPKGTSLEVYDEASGRTIYLSTTRDHTLSRGPYNRIICIEGESESIAVDRYQIDSLNRYYFNEPRIALNSIEVGSKGELWEIDPDAFLSTSDGPTYSVHRTSDGRVMVKISPLARRLIDEGEEVVEINYTLSQGSEGILGTNSEVNFTNHLTDRTYNRVNPDRVTISVVNSGGGVEPTGLEDIRKYLGQESSSTETLVNEDDYSNIPNYVDNLYHVVARSDTNGVIQVYYEPDEDYPNLEELELELYKYIEKRVLLFTKFELNRVLERPISLVMDVYLNRNVLNTERIETSIREYLTTEYSKSNQSPGTPLLRSQLSSRLAAIDPLISHIIINEPVIDIQSEWNQMFDISRIGISFRKVER